MKKIFFYSVGESADVDDASFLLTEQLEIKFAKKELKLLDYKDDFFKEYAIPAGAGIENYIFIFTDAEIKYSFEGTHSNIKFFDSEINHHACRVSGSWQEEGYIIIQYIVKNVKEFDDDALINICLGDVSSAETQYAYVGAIKIDYESIEFHSALTTEYLKYLDVLVDYSEFRSKITHVFDYVFSKINQFYLKLESLKADMLSVFHDLKKVKTENSRSALIVQSIYSGMEFDENTVKGTFELIDGQYESIRTFTKSINETRQSNVAESLNTIMFWVAIISFFFGLISFYDKYQSSDTFNHSATAAFTSTSFILLPFALLFIIVFMRNGVMFERLSRLQKLAVVKWKSSGLYTTLRRNISFGAELADPSWSGSMEYLTTDLVNSLLPQRQIAEANDLLGQFDAEKSLYIKKIKPLIRRKYYSFITQLHWKINRLTEEKLSIKIRSRKQQFDLTVSEICIFTTLNNWLLESNEIKKDAELTFIDTVRIHSLYAQWIKTFDADLGLISVVANKLANFDNLNVQNLTAKYLSKIDEELSSLMESIYKDVDYEYKEDILGMILSTFVQMDSPYWDSDAIPAYMPDAYLELDDDNMSIISGITRRSIIPLREALWRLNVEDYLEFMEIEMNKISQDKLISAASEN